MTAIADILVDSKLDSRARTDALLLAQAEREDLGARELTQVAATTTDVMVARKSAAHLSRIAGFVDGKREASRRLFADASLREASSTLVCDWDETLIGAALELLHQSPGDPGLAYVIFELAIYFPDRLRPHAGQVSLDETRDMMFCGAPDSAVDALAEKYRRSKDVALLERIGFARTPAALEKLRGLSVSKRQKDTWLASLENAGQHLDGSPAHTHEIFRGHVARAKASPHRIGGTASGRLPQCVKCGQPAELLLRLHAPSLPFGLSGRREPAFFFFTCACNVHDNAVVRVTDHGFEALLGPACDGTSSRNVFASERSMVLVPHPNQRGYGDTFAGTSGLHQVGGPPPWFAVENSPRCPDCAKPTLFLAALDSGLSSFERLSWKGTLFGFWCDACAVSWTRKQAGRR